MSNSAPRSRDRQRKRAWLRLVGALPSEDSTETWAEQGVGSSSTSFPQIRPLTSQSIDTSIGSIELDHVWACTAVMDTIESVPEALATSDVDTLKHLLDVGFAASQRNTAGHDDGEQLALRSGIVRRMRMFDIWKNLQDRVQNRAETAVSSDTQEEEEEEEDDPWAEDDEAVNPLVSSTSPRESSPTAADVLAFINQSPLQLATELAVRYEAEMLVDLLEAAKDSGVRSDVVRCRRGLVKLVLVSGATSSDDLGLLAHTGILLRCQPAGEEELGSWGETQKEGQEDETQTYEGDQSLAESLEPLARSQRMSRQEVIDFYEDMILIIEEETGSLAAAIQVASLAPALGLPEKSFEVIAQDLLSMQRYTEATLSNSAGPISSALTLHQFRKANEEAALDPVARTRMASQFLLSAGSRQEAAAAAKTGVIPFLFRLAQREGATMSTTSTEHESQDERVESFVLASFVALLLHLAGPSFKSTKEDGLTLARWLLRSTDDELGIAWSTKERIKVAIASVLGQQGANTHLFDAFAQILATPFSSSLQSTTSHPTVSIHHLVGPALASSSTASLRCNPAIVYPFLSSADESALVEYLDRLSEHLRAAKVFLRWTDAATPTTLAWFTQAIGKEDEQTKGVTKLVRSFSRRQHRTGNDWTALWREIKGLVGARQALELVGEKKVDEIVMEAILRTGDLSLYRTMHSSSSLSATEKDEMILEASRELYDNSSNPNHHTGSMRTAYEILGLGSSDSVSLKREREFIEATSRFCSFRVSSKLHASVPLAPIEIRLESDRLKLLARLLAQKEDVYKTPDLILDLAKKLCNVPSPSSSEALPDVQSGSALQQQQKLMPKALVEVKTLAMLADAATAASDYDRAVELCERLVASILALRRRAQAASSHHARTASQDNNDQAVQDEKSSRPSAAPAISVPIEEAEEIGWKTLLQVTKDPSWDNVALKLKLMGQVLSLCPSSRLPQLLQTWRKLDQEYAELIERDPQAAQKMLLQQPGSGASMTSADGKGGFMVSNAAAGILGLGASAAAAAAAAAGSNLPSGIMEGATSPFSALFANAGLRSYTSASSSNKEQHGSKNTKTTDTEPQREYGRAAQLFDGLAGDSRSTRRSSSTTPSGGGGGGGLYLDPAERAARAARNFFGNFASSSSNSSNSSTNLVSQQTDEHGHPIASSARAAEGGESGSGVFSLSRGVGWLIGESDERARR